MNERTLPRRPARAASFGVLGAAALLGGCMTLIPPYERPAAPVPDAYAPETTMAVPAGREPAGRHRLAALLQRRAAEAADRDRARQQPRPARRGAQHRAGARAVPDPPRRRAADRSAPAPTATRQPNGFGGEVNTYAVGLVDAELRARLLRPRAQPERGGAGAVPGHRRGAQDRADQPDRRRRQRLPEPAGRRRDCWA